MNIAWSVRRLDRPQMLSCMNLRITAARPALRAGARHATAPMFGGSGGARQTPISSRRSVSIVGRNINCRNENGLFSRDNLIIRRFLTPLNSSRTMGSVRRGDDNSRGKVQNVLCQEERASFGARHAVPEMKVGPSEPAFRSRLQTTVSCFGPMAEVVNVTEKA